MTSVTNPESKPVLKTERGYLHAMEMGMDKSVFMVCCSQKLQFKKHMNEISQVLQVLGRIIFKLFYRI